MPRPQKPRSPRTRPRPRRRPVRSVPPALSEESVAWDFSSHGQEGSSADTIQENKFDDIDGGAEVIPEVKARNMSLISSSRICSDKIPQRNSAIWIAHICLLPSSLLPWADGINAYKRFLSQGLNKMVAVNGPSSEAFASAISQTFGPLIQNRPWAPLQAKIYDDESLQGTPVLIPLVPSLARWKYDFEFLRTRCAILDADGKIDSLYIGLEHSIPSWDYLTTSRIFLPNFQISSEYDPSLDPDEPLEVDQKNGEREDPSNGLPLSLEKYFLVTDERAKESENLRSPIVHELAVREMTFEELQSRWPNDDNEFKPTLDKVADFDPSQQKYALKKMHWKELDVFRYGYDSDEERQKAIDNAIRMYDRMRVSTTDPIWQKLLPKEERGNGKHLSKLQAKIAGFYQPPTIHDDSQPRRSLLAPDANGDYIGPEAVWTRIERDLISARVLTRAGLRYEARPDYVAVLGKLSSEEIVELTRKSAKVRANRESMGDDQAHPMDPMIMSSMDSISTGSVTMVIRAPYTEQTTLDNFLRRSFGYGEVSLLWKEGRFHCTLPRSLSPDELELLDQIVHGGHYGTDSSHSSGSSAVLKDQDTAPATDMVSLDRAETQGHHGIPDTDMSDILCYLLPRSAAASQEIEELLLRGSPYVQVIPDNLKQYLRMIGGNEYGIALRRSNPCKTPAKGFVFGTNASTCDILFTSEELRNIQFRIYEDENGVVTVQDQSARNRMHEATATGVYVAHPGDRRERAWNILELTMPLQNASKILFLTESRHSRWDFSVFLPVHEETSEYADVESLASVTDVPTLTSGTSFSSLGSYLDVSEATEVLAKLLLKDVELGPLFHASLQRTAPEKIERNYTRLLIGFARDLRKEATNLVEHHVGRLVKFRARFISQTLVSAIDPSRRDRTAQWESFLHQDEQREGRMEQFLESLTSSDDFLEATKGAPPPIDSDGNVSDESGEEGNPPKLSQIKDFILSSKALAILRKRLKTFVSPEEAVSGTIEQSDTQGASEGPVDERLSNLEVLLGTVLRLAMRIDQRTVASLTNSFLRFSRPRVPEGHQRITWICGCGKAMYSDVQELYDGGAAGLEQDLRRAADGAASPTTTSGSNNAPQGTTQRQGSSSSNTSAMSGSTLALPSGPGSTPGVSVTQGGSTSIHDPPQGPPITNRFVLLCVNGPRFRQLQQVPLASQQVSIASHDNDRILFDNIRRAYIEVRQSYQPRFHPETPAVVKIFVGWIHRAWRASQKLITEVFKLLKIQWLVWWIGDDVFFVPKSADFVKFEVIPIKQDHVPEILESACLPPEEEVLNRKNYHYDPCPQQVRNVVLRIPLLHELFEPGLHTSDFWTRRTPKKLVQMLDYPSPDPVIGWGVHIVEGPNWHALAVLTVMFNVLCLVIASIYSAVTSDVSSGFALGSFFLAVETMVVTLVLAVLTTSLFYNG